MSDLPKGKIYSMILEVKFKDDHGKIDKGSSFTCFDQNNITQNCHPVDNGFYLTILSNSRGFKANFTACAERLISLKGCVLKTV